LTVTKQFNHPRRPNSRGLFAPLVLAELYLFGTFFLFWITSLRDEAVGLGLLTVFVVACHLALLGGYLFFFRKPRLQINSFEPPIAMMRWVTAAAVLWSVAFWAQTYRDEGDTSGLMHRMSSPGESYLMRRELFKEHVDNLKPVSRLGQLEMCASILSFCLPVFGILIWTRLGFILKGGVVFALAIIAVVALATGTNEPFGHLVMLVSSALLIRRYGFWPAAPKPAGSARRNSQLVIAVGVVFGFVVFMGYNLENRLNARRYYDPRANVGDLASLDFLPFEVREALSHELFYPANGYCGLSYALQMPFEWTKGVGSSRGIQGYLKDYLGVEGILERTYPFRAEKIYDWPAGGYWWTMYPWLASDLTFPGVVVFMFMLGWAFAKTWYESIRLNDPFAALVFTVIFFTIGFVPANPQLLMLKNEVWTEFGALALYCLPRTMYAKIKPIRRSGDAGKLNNGRVNAINPPGRRSAIFEGGYTAKNGGRL